ncbi:MAG: peptide ABC transporter substrate-binding protein [Chloroflexi bacterium]|nr:peptide ABC transporter substrate-binding protein [Chloroflexota bacterium]
MKKAFRALPALVVTFAMLLAVLPTSFALASDADITLASLMQEAEPITHYRTDTSQISTIDPQRASDQVSIEAIEQLFLGLTNADPLNPGNIVPELATSWEVSEDGTVWTFTVRNDVPWVRWDPVTDEAEVLRNVTAGDIAYGIKRSCDPRLGAYYTSVADKIILGCNEVSQKPVEEVTDADYDLVQVEAPDDTTLVVNLQFSAGYFFSQTPMWMYRPVPQEIIEEFGDDWTELGNLVSNGPFVMDEWVRGVRRVYLQNPHLPADLRGPGNVERVVVTIVEDAGTIFALYQDNQIDSSGVPSAELQSVLADPAYESQLNQTSDLAVFYLAFAHDKAPFDNVNLRRAFSASLDRAAFVQEIRQGRGVPMIHLTPPGMFGAPPINEVGVGYNPDYARAQMEAAGFANCEGLPNLELVAYTGAGNWAEFMAASAERELGCDANIFTIEQQEFSVLLETVDPRNPSEDRPHMWTLGWGPDYPDANNWVGDVLACDSENTFRRPCTEVDDLIDQAAEESDPETRIELYYRVEEMFFGEEGEHPIVTLFMRIDYTLAKPWYTGPFETDGLFGGPHYDYRSIDQEAQLAARAG